MFKAMGLGISILVLSASALTQGSAWANDQSDNEIFAMQDRDCDGEYENGGDGKNPECRKGPHGDFYRLDCRFHNEERIRGIKFCYASAFYQKGEGHLKNIHLGVGCDNETLFNDLGRLQKETTLDRLSPLRAATPGVEIFPQGQLLTEGTYTSVLDIPYGRLLGLCYVHKIH